MNNNIDLKQIWNTQEIETPKVKDLYHKANRYKRKALQKLIIVNVLCIITSIVIGAIWYYYQPKLVTTKIGIILAILAMGIFIAAYNGMFSLLSKKSIEFNSKEYLEQLIKLNKKQLFQQTTMMSTYFILLSLGIALYLFEYVSKMTIVWGMFAYGMTTLWIAFNWFYLRPIIIKKQAFKINELLLKFKELSNQIMS